MFINLKKMILPNYTLNQGKNYLLQRFSLRFNFLIPKPLNLIIFLTYRCNLRCKYCSSWKCLKRDKELGISDWKDIILQFKKWVGPYHLTLTGGEPLQKESIASLIKFLQNKNIRVSLLTNGSLFDKRLYKEIMDSKVYDITISLDSLKPKVHDYLSGKKGSCKTVKSNVELLKDLNRTNKTKIYLATVINKLNLEEVTDLVEYTKNIELNGIKFQAINFNTVSNNTYDKNWYKKNNLWPQDQKKIENIIGKLTKMKKDYPIWNSKKQLKTIEYFFKNPVNEKYKCMANRKNICVDPYGNLGFCEMKNKLGNVHNQELKEFWYSKKAKQIRGEECNRTCMYLNSNLDKGSLERIKELITIQG